jgi:sugar phosphate isomerase/epimerase
MKLGLFTAAFPDKSLDEIASWSSKNGFHALEIACWPISKADRRYSGVTHIDVTTLTADKAAKILGLLAEYELPISALGYYPNILDPDKKGQDAAINHLKKVILAAELLGVEVVGTFIGKNHLINNEENFVEFSKIWPDIVHYAGDHHVKIAIENCPMIFSYDEWPGGKNLASTPAIWRRMWDIIPDENFGLNLDPSHLILQMIDYERVIREFSSRIFHVHAKDLMIDWEGIYNHGVFSQGMGWQIPRLPGLGDMKWDKFIAALYAAGYDSVISVEHEDRSFEGDEDLVKRGFLIARDALSPYIH